MKLLCVLLLFLALLFPFKAPSQQASGSLVLTNVTVIDVMAEDPLKAIKVGLTVVVTGNRITAIGQTGKVKLPEGAQVVDAGGRYLMPGLWDMHVHTMIEGRPDYVFPLLIANGITSVRDMGGNLPFDRMIQLRNRIENGGTVGPRIVAVAGRTLDGPGAKRDDAIVVSSADEGRQVVRSLKQAGADFVNVSDRLSQNVYEAIVDEADQQRLPVAGNVPFAMTAEEVSDLGQKSIERATDLLVSGSSDQEKLREELKQSTNFAESARLESELNALTKYDERKNKSLFARFVRNQTWQCPTLVALRSSSAADNTQLSSDPRGKYIPSKTSTDWNQTFKARIGPIGTSEQRKKRFDNMLQIVGLMQRAGVGIIAGTDLLSPYVYPGFSIHDELRLLVDAGLTPLEAVRAATVNPARFFKSDLGVIEKGKLADMVLLDGNPLDNIRNTQRIYGVVANGRFFPDASLKKLLIDAESAAKRN